MHYIKTTVSKKIDENVKMSLQKKLGEAIALIPGKTETWLMLAFEDDVPMAFQGKSDSDYAFVDVSIFGSASDAAYDRLTAAICSIMEEDLGIAQGNTYVKYEESNHWGWNGRNF